MSALLRSGLVFLLLQTLSVHSEPIVTNIAAGDSHSLFIKSDGSLWGMGDNRSGQIGELPADSNRPGQVVAHDVVAVAGGYHHSLFLKSDGSLWAMGNNYYGQLGIGLSNSPTSTFPVPQEIVSNDVKAIAAGSGHSLFLKSDGSLWGMGYNRYGELGDGTTNNALWPERIVADGVIAIAAGGYHSLFLKSDHSLWAMGANFYGQLGDSTMTNALAPKQIVPNGVREIAAGYYHSLFIKSDDSLWAMGSNGDGQLGDGTTTNRSSPVEVASNKVVAAAAGLDFSVFLKSDGSLWGMGRDYYGQLGDGLGDPVLTPKQVVSGGVMAIACGTGHTLFVKSDGSLWAMGDDYSSQLGDGFRGSWHVPERVVPPPQPSLAASVLIRSDAANAVTNSAAGAFYSMFLRADGSLWAMGRNDKGQLGDGTFDAAMHPEEVVADGVVCVSVGHFYNLAAGGPSSHTLFLKSDGSLWAMGLNQGGQLGDGTYNSANQPEGIESNNVVAISAGYGSSLFVKSDGSLWAMGGIVASQTNRPEQVISNSVVTVAAGGYHSLFLKSNGSLWGMGRNYLGQLGDGSLNYKINPPERIVSSNVVAITAGLDHSLFVKSDGSLWAMGYNYYGQLGIGPSNSPVSTFPVPQEIVSNDVKAIAAGDSHSLFLKSDGSLWAMGYNNYGQLGDGTTSNSFQPEQIVSSGVVAISAGYSHSLFVKSDGTLWGMGDNSYGELGSGLGNALVPRQLTAGKGDLVFRATCVIGGPYRLLMSTNLDRPLDQWTPVETNNVTLRGENNFTAIITKVLDSGEARQFYILQSQ